ncbi:hypothetical protein VNO77_20389 [Canavalia gladiata]|uniref:Uncharacterized protein n=1 Tax=Canavalia gladiata TaxID=3824 RepID=A0AAN9QQI3_CANGL
MSDLLAIAALDVPTISDSSTLIKMSHSVVQLVAYGCVSKLTLSTRNIAIVPGLACEMDFFNNESGSDFDHLYFLLSISLVVRNLRDFTDGTGHQWILPT